MKLSIVTPSYNSMNYIEKCIASVADQKNVDIEHIIQDGGSTDKTCDILNSKSGIRFYSEPDSGMYDAINKGFNQSTGDIFAHINADEQYLPGSLKIVADFFHKHPNIDILFTDIIVLTEDASFVCYQKVIKPTKSQIILSHLPTYTAGTFFRRKIWDAGIHFDISKKALGDSLWMLDIIKKEYKMACKRCYTTTVTATRENLSLSDVAHKESQELFRNAGNLAHIKWLSQFLKYRSKKMIHKCYYQKKLSYAVFTNNNIHTRQSFTAVKPSPFWIQMHKLKSINYYIKHDD